MNINEIINDILYNKKYDIYEIETITHEKYIGIILSDNHGEILFHLINIKPHYYSNWDTIIISHSQIKTKIVMLNYIYEFFKIIKGNINYKLKINDVIEYNFNCDKISIKFLKEYILIFIKIYGYKYGLIEKIIDDYIYFNKDSLSLLLGYIKFNN